MSLRRRRTRHNERRWTFAGEVLSAVTEAECERLASLAPLDLVVHAVFAAALAERLEPRLSPYLFSYRRGRSQRTSILQ